MGGGGAEEDDDSGGDGDEETEAPGISALSLLLARVRQL